MLLDDEAKQAFSRFTQTLEDRTSQVARIHQTVREAQEDIDGGLAALERSPRHPPPPGQTSPQPWGSL